MRLRRIELQAYGRFSDHAFDFAQRPSDLHLIVGPNEAGKSTTRNALSELLFGIAHNSRYAFLHGYGALRIGATLEEGGENISVVRKKGKKNTLLDPAGEPLAEQTLKRFLGHANREFFERMFSLDHASLVAGAHQLLDAKDDLGRLLFQASGGLLKLGELEERLRTEADKLWAPRHSKGRAYYAAFDLYNEQHQKLLAQTVSAKQYRDASSRLETARSNTLAVIEEQRERLQDCARLARIKRVRLTLARRRQCRFEREQLGQVVMLPEDSALVLQEARAQIARSDDEIQRLVREIATLKELVATPGTDPDLLARSAEIYQLDAQRHKFESYPDDLAKRRAEVALLWAEAQRYATDLGWSATTPEQLRQMLPSLLEEKALSQHLGQRQRFVLDASSAASALEKRHRELTDLLRERDPAQDAGAPSSLRDTLEEARRLGDAERRLRELMIPAEQSKKQLLAAFAQLAPWKGDLMALRSLALPSDEEVEGLRQRAERIQEELRQLELDRQRDQNKLSLLRLQLGQLERDQAIVSRQELDRCRAERDAHFEHLRTICLNPMGSPTEQGALFEQQTTLNGHADTLADRRFEAAALSARLEQLVEEIEQQEHRLSLCDAQQATLERQQIALGQQLARLVVPLGLAIEHPAILHRWLQSRGQALELGAKAEREYLLVQQLERELAQAELTLRAALTSCQVAIPGEKSVGFTALLRLAASTVTRLDEERTRQRALAEQTQRLELTLPDLLAQNDRAAQALAGWQQRYVGYLTQLGLSTSMTPEVAETALGILAELRLRLDKAEETQRERIDKMTRNLDEFRAKVDALVRALAPELVGRDPFEQIHQLLLRLQQQERLLERTEQNRQRLEQFEQALSESQRTRAQAEASLCPLYELAETRELSQLSQAIARSDLARSLEKARSNEDRTLHEIGDGLDLDELEREAQSVPAALVEELLEQQERALHETSERRRALELEQHEAERALALIGGQGDAAKTLDASSEALASMSDAIERYLQLRTASVLLRWAIERFRREKQGPLLARSSKLFSLLTLGRYQGLSIEYDEQNQPHLIGVNAVNQWISLEAMSAGTTDQLYLALRIAALELHLETAPALPFVADDLFIHFDDERSQAAFRVLAELAQRTQVLFLTHHPHLVEVAKQALGSDVSVNWLR